MSQPERIQKQIAEQVNKKDMAKGKITELVTPEAIAQIDSLMAKIKEATELQKALNAEIEKGNTLSGKL